MAKARGIPKRTPEQKAEVGAFIDRLYELSGAATNVEFAGRAGLYGSNVGEYRTGTTMPDAYTLIRLMSSVEVELRAKDEIVDLPAPPIPLARSASAGEVDRVTQDLREEHQKTIDRLAELAAMNADAMQRQIATQEYIEALEQRLAELEGWREQSAGTPTDQAVEG